MADPLSISARILALTSFAFKSSITLYKTVRSFQSQDKNARALKSELGELTHVLESLLKTVNSNPDLDFKALERPLRRCGKACEEYGELISRCTKHSTTSRSSFRDWITQRYLQGDITEFKAMLASYKSTINIALASVNIRVAAITPRVLEDYQDVICDTTSDLQEHLERLEQKVQSLDANSAEDAVQCGTEWQALLEEKQSTQQGLKLCAQLSAQIDQLGPTLREHPQFMNHPSARKYVRAGLVSTTGSIQDIVSRLRKHEENLDKQLETVKAALPHSESNTTQLAQLQETKESIRQCIDIVSAANQDLTGERRNVFEDITMADDTYDFSVSTIGDLVTARRINLKGRARHIGGQISDESYQRTIDALTQRHLASEGPWSATHDLKQAQPTLKFEDGSSSTIQFSDRYGRGFRLPSYGEMVSQAHDINVERGPPQTQLMPRTRNRMENNDILFNSVEVTPGEDTDVRCPRLDNKSLLGCTGDSMTMFLPEDL